MGADEEYIDYSCSTPIERLSRDVETLLRSWHISNGSDRHVSFHGEATAGNTTGNTTSHTTGNTTTSISGRMRASKDGTVAASSPVRKSFSTTSCTTTTTTTIAATTTVEDLDNGIRLLRSAKVNLVTLPPNSTRHQDRITLELTLCLWDGPPSSSSSFSSSSPGNSSSNSNSTNSTPRRKIFDNKNNDLKSNTNNNTNNNNNNNTNELLPLSLKSHRLEHPFAISGWNILSNLSSILGIGQHLTLSPTSSKLLSSYLQLTIDALIQAHHPSSQGYYSTFQPRNFFFSPSSTSDGGSISASTSTSTTGNFKNSSNSVGGGGGGTSGGTSGTGGTDYGMNISMEDHVTLHTAALHSLSNQLQTALNTATAACDCRIPAFGIWGMYGSSSSSSSDNSTKKKSHVSLDGSASTTTKTTTQQATKPYLLQSIMDIPKWMNGGDLFQLSADSSPCSAFIRHFDTLKHLVEEEQEEEEEEKFKDRDPVALSIPTSGEESGNSSSCYTKDDNEEEEKDEAEQGDDAMLVNDSTLDAEGKRGNDSGSTNTIKKLSKRKSRRTKQGNKQSSSQSTSSSTSIPKTPSTTTTPRLTSILKNQRYNKRRNGPSSSTLYLPPFILGYCHPGSSFFGKGASFAIHVVPPGFSYPVHCTTLNSLGQLLLQHSRPKVRQSSGVSSSWQVKKIMQRRQRHRASMTGGTTTTTTTSSSSTTNALSDFQDYNNNRDPNLDNKVVVAGARHKYNWSKLFEFYHDSMEKQETYFEFLAVNWDQLNTWTCNLSWRKSISPTFSSSSSSGSSMVMMNPVTKKGDKGLQDYVNQCHEHVLEVLYRATYMVKAGNTMWSSFSLEPLWGPRDDPVYNISISVLWENRRSDRMGSATTIAADDSAPLLTLPLRIRSQHMMSSEDILEMENTLLNSIFNPLSVPARDFSASVSFDPHTACTTLSATNRCILAGFIRTATLQPDTLLAHLTKSSILKELHENPTLRESLHDILSLSKVGNTTRNLVEAMDWSSMGSMEENEGWHTGSWTWKDIISHILDGSEMRSFPIPPEEEQPSVLAQKINQMYSKKRSQESSSSPAECLPNATRPGRLLSVLFSCMASLRTPSAMAGLWLEFVEELRLRWESRESLQNLGMIPGIDSVQDQASNNPNGIGGDPKVSSIAGMCEKRSAQHFSLGSNAKHVAFVNSSEANPDLNECLISQKLQVFNIGVETQIAAEAESLRRLEMETSAINISAISYDGEEGDENDKEEENEKAEDINASFETNTSHEGGVSHAFGVDDLDPLSEEDIPQSKETDYAGGGEDSNDGDDSCTSSNSIDDYRGNLLISSSDDDMRTVQTTTTGDFQDAFSRMGTTVNSRDHHSDNSSSPGSLSSDELSDDGIGRTLIVDEISANVAQRQQRRGARCPVLGLNLVASGDQLYAPYLQRPTPATDDSIIEHNRMLSNQLGGSLRSSIEDQVRTAHRLQRPKLMSDMASFKAANPGGVFQDFIKWYGNPENPLQQCDNEDIFDLLAGFPGENQDNEADKTTSKDISRRKDEADYAVFILNETRSFWSDTWDEASPCPASEQDTLFDAFSTVEMLLTFFESLHPSHLMNQILAVNLAMASFVLRTSKPKGSIRKIDQAIRHLEETIAKALFLLGNDLKDSILPSVSKSHVHDSFTYISSETITTCEKACDLIGDVEIVLSRATSLLSKFNNDFELVQRVLEQPENTFALVAAQESRSGILGAIHVQQQKNSGIADVAMNDFPFPSVREYVLRNRDDLNPCQLMCTIGGTHGLEKGGTNSTKGGLVLALNKTVSEFR